ncbi:MAG: TetR/AcrR family transcriptional regulator [Bullifex sp.]
MSSSTTKIAISWALKELVKEKPLNKITIQDIADRCGINRQTFYYHFQDIIDLVRWTLYTDAEKLIRGNKTYDTWQKGYLAVFRTIEQDKTFILNIYHHAPREYITDYLYSVTLGLLTDVVKEKEREMGLRVREDDIMFIANFFKYSLVGIVLDWIGKGMEEKSEVIVSKLDSIIHGTIEKALMNAAVGKT